MQKRKTIRMRRRNAIRIRKRKRAKQLIVAMSILLVLIFFVKEILKERLEVLHNSIAAAASEVRIENGQSDLFLQNLMSQQTTETENLLREKKEGREPALDFSYLISQDEQQVKSAKAELRSSFDRTSRLIDQLPASAKGYRQLRDDLRKRLEKIEDRVDQLLKLSVDDDATHFLAVKVDLMAVLAAKAAVDVLANATLKAAEQVQQATETLILACSWLIAVLFLLSAGLGLYAKLKGTDSLHAE